MTARASFTKAQLRRVLDVLAERGLTPSEVVETREGLRLRLTDGSDAPLPSSELTDSDWSKKLAQWRRSA